MTAISKEIPTNTEKASGFGEKPLLTPTESSPAEMTENSADKQSGQEKFNKEVLGNQHKLLEKLESIENRLEKLENQRDPIEAPTEKIPIDIKSSEQHLEEVKPRLAKQFVLRHTFKNMSATDPKKQSNSTREEFFGVEWGICTYKNDDKLSLFLNCHHNVKGLWLISTDFDLKVINRNGIPFSKSIIYSYNKAHGYGFSEFVKWEAAKKDYLVDDELKVEAHVKITEMSGVYKYNLRNFDETMKELSDIVLTVNDQQFYVAKLFLATHSTYFKTMFLGKFGDSKQSEITLTGIDPDDFQKYLEVLYGDLKAIDEFSVEGILLIADMYDTQSVIEKCEEFLVEKSKKSLKKKLQMAARYSLETLKKKCLGGIETIDDIRSVTTDDIQDMDPSLIAILFKKSISLN